MRPAILLALVASLLLAPSASAQKSKEVPVISSLFGVSIGTTLEEARSKLSPLGTGGGRDTRDGGRKEAWTIKGTDYATLAFKTNSQGKVVWVSAFARPDRRIPFSKLGNLSKAATSETQAVWNVETPKGNYRLVAKGVNGKANVVYLLSLESPEPQ